MSEITGFLLLELERQRSWDDALEFLAAELEHLGNERSCLQRQCREQRSKIAEAERRRANLTESLRKAEEEIRGKDFGIAVLQQELEGSQAKTNHLEDALLS